MGGARRFTHRKMQEKQKAGRVVAKLTEKFDA
jgi:hypothetical protein